MAELYYLRDTTRSTCLGAGDDLDLNRTQGTLATWVSGNVSSTDTYEVVATFDIDVRDDGATPADGSHNVRVNCSALSSGATWRYRIEIVNSTTGCTVQQSSSYSTEYTTTGLKSEAMSFTIGG